MALPVSASVFIHEIRFEAWQPALVELNSIADHPQLKLFQPGLPARLELTHPIPVGSSLWNIDDDSYQFVAIYHAAVPPMPFDHLRFITGRCKPLDHFQNRFGNQGGWDFPAVIEPQRQEDFVAPPLVARTSLCHAQ